MSSSMKPVFEDHCSMRFSWELVPTIPHRLMTVVEWRWRFLVGMDCSILSYWDFWYWISPLCSEDPELGCDVNAT